MSVFYDGFILFMSLFIVRHYNVCEITEWTLAIYIGSVKVKEVSLYMRQGVTAPPATVSPLFGDCRQWCTQTVVSIPGRPLGTCGMSLWGVGNYKGFRDLRVCLTLWLITAPPPPPAQSDLIAISLPGTGLCSVSAMRASPAASHLLCVLPSDLIDSRRLFLQSKMFMADTRGG